MASKRLTLKTTPPGRLSIGEWAGPSVERLSAGQKRRFYALKQAITDHVGGAAITALLSRLSIPREVFYRAFDKCVALDARGKPFGWVGLLPYLELQPRQRRAPVAKCGHGGLAGVFKQFLRENVDIAHALEAYLLLNATRKPGGEAGIRHKSVHMEFLRLCTIKDPQEQAWPFTSRRKAAGALRAYVCSYLAHNYDKIVATQYGSMAATKAKAGNGEVSRLVACMPFDVVEMDEHDMGCIGTVRIDTPEGARYVDAGRMRLLLLADRHKQWILAFKVIYRDAPNSGDALDVLHAGMVGEPDWAHHKAGQAAEGPLVALDARFGWCGFNCLLLDNALIHLCDELTSRVTALSGCALNFGPVATPARRQMVERILEALERFGFKRLPATTGAGPKDLRRQDPEAAARACILPESEIVALVAGLVRKLNTNIGKHNLAASPAQRMRSLICGDERDGYLFPFLPPLRDGEADLSKSVVTVPIKGDQRTGRRPYFSYLEADYTSPLLARDWELLDEFAVLHVSRANIRFIEAFVRGRPLGACAAGGRWRWSDHSIDLRRVINQMLREGYIENDRKDDVVVAFLQRVAQAYSASGGSPRALKPAVRHYGDHRIRRDVGEQTLPPVAAGPVDAERAVTELLDRASDSTVSRYLAWDDIGAFNGDV